MAFAARSVKTVASHFLCLLTVGGRRPLTASCRSEWKLAASLIQQLFHSLSSSAGLISIIILALKFTSPSSVSKVEPELFGWGSALGLLLGAAPGQRPYRITAITRYSRSSQRDISLGDIVSYSLQLFGLLKTVSLARSVAGRSNRTSASRALILAFCR